MSVVPVASFSLGRVSSVTDLPKVRATAASPKHGPRRCWHAGPNSSLAQGSSPGSAELPPRHAELMAKKEKRQGSICVAFPSLGLNTGPAFKRWRQRGESTALLMLHSMLRGLVAGRHRGASLLHLLERMGPGAHGFSLALAEVIWRGCGSFGGQLSDLGLGGRRRSDGGGVSTRRSHLPIPTGGSQTFPGPAPSCAARMRAKGRTCSLGRRGFVGLARRGLRLRRRGAVPLTSTSLASGIAAKYRLLVPRGRLSHGARVTPALFQIIPFGPSF